MPAEILIRPHNLSATATVARNTNTEVMAMFELEAKDRTRTGG